MRDITPTAPAAAQLTDPVVVSKPRSRYRKVP
jgi:hypothetical protein